MTRISHDRLLEVLAYDRETGIFTWKKQLAPRGKVGTQAGCLCRKSGYVLVRVDGILYRANMLAWFYVTGQWPEKLIDHKDCDRANDSFSNLREATYSQNFQNAPIRKNNMSGLKGVSWDASRGLWRAQIAKDKRHICIGRYDSKEAAHQAYVASANELFGEFARAG